MLSASPAARNQSFRSSLVMVSMKKDGGWCTIAKDYKPRYQGPAHINLPYLNMDKPTCLDS